MASRVHLDGARPGRRGAASGGGGSAAIVFLHGLGGSSYSWWAQLAACEARGLRAIAYDQRGAGRSAKPGGPYSVGLWAEDVERMLDRLEVGRAILVGHSVGCMIAEQAAVRLGDRVNGLAMIGGALRWRPRRGRCSPSGSSSPWRGAWRRSRRPSPQTGLSEACRRAEPGARRPVSRADRFERPARLCGLVGRDGGGGDDRPRSRRVPGAGDLRRARPGRAPAFAEAIAEAMPSAGTAVIEGAAHWCQLEAPAAVNDVLARVLRRDRNINHKFGEFRSLP